jgi:hypothetical protein
MADGRMTQQEMGWHQTPAELDRRLNNIEGTCSPRGDNHCLHEELKGLTLLETSVLMARYGTDTAAKHLAPLSLHSLENLLDSLPGGGGNLRGSDPGNGNIYEFQK